MIGLYRPVGPVHPGTERLRNRIAEHNRDVQVHINGGNFMSTPVLQTLIGTALIDREFSEELLNGRRPTLLARLDLTDEERAAALAIKANSVQEFAIGLYEQLVTRPN